MSTKPIFGRINATVVDDFNALAAHQKENKHIAIAGTLGDVIRLGVEQHMKINRIPASVLSKKKK